MNFQGNPTLPISSTTGENVKFQSAAFGSGDGAVSWAPSPINDVYELRFTTDAGQYDISINRLPGTVGGIWECRVNGVLVDTFDSYAAAYGPYNKLVVSDHHLIAGENAITFTNIGKNASSTNYFLLLGGISIVPI